MTLIKICDRCRKETKNIASFRYYGGEVKTNNKLLSYGSKFDLCKKCTKDFENYIRNEN